MIPSVTRDLNRFIQNNKHSNSNSGFLATLRTTVSKISNFFRSISSFFSSSPIERGPNSKPINISKRLSIDPNLDEDKKLTNSMVHHIVQVNRNCVKKNDKTKSAEIGEFPKGSFFQIPNKSGEIDLRQGLDGGWRFYPAEGNIHKLEVNQEYVFNGHPIKLLENGNFVVDGQERVRK